MVVASAGPLDHPVPMEGPLPRGRVERRRTPHAVHFLLSAPDGMVLGVSVPPDKVHPLLESLLVLSAEVYAMLIDQQRQREEFLSLAHEVRNPLMLIAGYTELLVHRGESEVSGLVLEEVRRVEERLEEFLTAGRPMSRALLDIADVLARVMRRYQAMLAAAGVRAAVEIQPAYVYGDAPQLEIAVANLVKNAVEAMPSGGRITLRCERVDQWASVCVEDTGPGIAREVMGQLFQPYVSTKPDGHGLGLSLVADVAERHGGRVELLPSESGAAFCIWLPSADPPAAST